MFATTLAAQGLAAAAMGGEAILIPPFVMLVLHGESLVPYPGAHANESPARGQVTTLPIIKLVVG